MNDINREEWKRHNADEEMAGWKDQLAGVIARILAVAGVVGLLVLGYLAGTKDQFWYMAIYVPVYLFFLIISFARRISYRLRIFAVIGIGLALALLTMAIFGINAESAYLLMTVVVLSTLFEGQKGGYLAVGLCVLGLLVLAWLFVGGWLVVRPNYTIRNDNLIDWLLTVAFFSAMAVSVLWALGYVLRRLTLLLAERQRALQELDRGRVELERQVAENAARLARQRAHLQAVAQVARELVVIQDADRLFSTAVSLIRDRFAQSVVSLYLLDERGEFLILRAVDSVEELPVPETGRQIRVAGSAAEQVVQLAQVTVLPPDPDDWSGRRMILPLVARGTVIGVLDVQGAASAQEVLDEQALLGWQMLADQLAAAIDNIRLRERLEQSLLGERQAYAAMTREGWQRVLSARPDLGFVRNRRGILPLDKKRLAKETAWPEEKPLVEASTLSLPIRVRDQVIGRLDARKPTGATWLPQEVELLETLTRELNDALENARLYQDTQRREAEQRLIGQVTAEVRRTLDVDTVLQTAIREIGRALSLSQVEVRLSGVTVPASDELQDEEGRP